MEKSKPTIDVPRLRRLYHFLTFYRLTIFLYGYIFLGRYQIWWIFESEFLTTLIIYFVSILAILFAPYMLFVLFMNKKHGWLLFFVIIVGLPLALITHSTGNPLFDIGLRYLPLVMFYLYCVLLRYSVADWMSDESPIGVLEIEEEERQNKLEQMSSGNRISDGSGT